MHLKQRLSDVFRAVNNGVAMCANEFIGYRSDYQWTSLKAQWGVATAGAAATFSALSVAVSFPILAGSIGYGIYVAPTPLSPFWDKVAMAATAGFFAGVPLASLAYRMQDRFWRKELCAPKRVAALTPKA